MRYVHKGQHPLETCLSGISPGRTCANETRPMRACRRRSNFPTHPIAHATLAGVPTSRLLTTAGWAGCKLLLPACTVERMCLCCGVLEQIKHAVYTQYTAASVRKALPTLAWLIRQLGHPEVGVIAYSRQAARANNTTGGYSLALSSTPYLDRHPCLEIALRAVLPPPNEPLAPLPMPSRIPDPRGK